MKKTETFLKSWTPQQFKQVEKSIVKFINSRYNITLHSKDADPFIRYNKKTFSGIDEILGLAYTSTGLCAGYWVCNTELYLDIDGIHKIIGFVLDKKGFTVAWVEDEDENAFFVRL